MTDSYRDVLMRPDGFDAFYRAHNDDLLKFFARRVYDPQVAFDLTAETFAQALLSRHRFRGREEAQARAWLNAIARHQLSRYYRRGTAERRAARRLGLEIPRLTEQEVAETEALAELEPLRDAVRRGLEGLTGDHRRALQLRVVEERPYGEVAAALGVSEQTARARVSRALRALAKAVDPEVLNEEALA